MMQFWFLLILDYFLSRYKQINEDSSSANISADSCVEPVIPETDDDGLQKKNTWKKATQYKNATIRNKFSRPFTLSPIIQ